MAQWQQHGQPLLARGGAITTHPCTHRACSSTKWQGSQWAMGDMRGVNSCFMRAVTMHGACEHHARCCMSDAFVVARAAHTASMGLWLVSSVAWYQLACLQQRCTHEQRHSLQPACCRGKHRMRASLLACLAQQLLLAHKTGGPLLARALHSTCRSIVCRCAVWLLALSGVLWQQHHLSRQLQTKLDNSRHTAPQPATTP